MKRLIFDILAVAALVVVASNAEDLPMRLDTELAQGNVTIKCQYLDFAGWPAVFRVTGAEFRCLITTKTADTTGFLVSIVSRDEAGKLTSAMDVTANLNGSSIIAFRTKDKALMSVTVGELKSFAKFDSSIE